MAEELPGTEGKPTTITTSLRRAMLTADNVSFHYYQGRSWLTCDLNRRDPGVFTRAEQIAFPETGDGVAARTVSIGCEVGLAGYTGESTAMWHGDPENRAGCFVLLYGGKRDEAWQTIATLVRPGDRLMLSWLADNNNDVIREAGLHADSLTLSVYRGEKKAYEFLVRHEVAPDNRARMIRRND